MARSAVTKVTIRKEGGFTKESIQTAYDIIGDVIDRPSAEALKGDFITAGEILKGALLAGAAYDPNRRRKTPHLRQGIFLAKNTQPGKPYVLVGVAFPRTPQGYWLEYGTSKMQAHPWFKRIMLAVRSQMAQIIADGVKRTVTG